MRQNAGMDFLNTPSHVIPAHEYRRERWRNQQGWTREILKLGPPGDAWALRLSIAEIEQDADFSAFPGIDRELVLLHGNGVRLRFEGGEEVALLPPHQRLRFPGEAALRGELVDGPTHDFNLMWRRDLLQATLLHRPLVGPMLFFSEPGVAWAIHLLGGNARFEADTPLPPLEGGDTAWLGAGPRTRYALHGAGELLAIRIEPRQHAAG
jgi:environmental stress-induced protein Ves